MNDRSFADEFSKGFTDYTLPPQDSEVSGSDDPDAPGDGRTSIKQQFAVSFFMPDGTVEGAIYSHFKGHPRRNRWRGSTEVKVYFMGVYKDQDGDWMAIFTGENLDKMHDELREGRRMSIRPSKTPKDGQLVKNIIIEKMEAQELTD